MTTDLTSSSVHLMALSSPRPAAVMNRRLHEGLATRKIISSVVFVALLFVALLVPALPAHAATLTMVGRWNMDENPINPNSSVLDSRHGNNGATPINWSGQHAAAIATRGSGAFLFPGWHNIVNGNQVDPTASSFMIPSSDAYNPDTSNFEVSIWVNTDDPTPALQAGEMIPDDTLNIVQKGLAGPIEQQWKISVSVTGKFLCSFRGPDSKGTDNLFVATSNTYAWSVTRRITCSWNATSHLITAKVSTGPVVDVYTAPGPVSVANTDPVSVGKKPGSTSPGDTFAGWLDNLVISKG